MKGKFLFLILIVLMLAGCELAFKKDLTGAWSNSVTVNSVTDVEKITLKEDGSFVKENYRDGALQNKDEGTWSVAIEENILLGSMDYLLVLQGSGEAGVSSKFLAEVKGTVLKLIEITELGYGNFTDYDAIEITEDEAASE
jgi:hypothetical protein